MAIANKIVGINGGTITIGGVDYEIESGSVKFEVEKIPYAPIGGNGWQQLAVNGLKKVTGNIKGAVDTTLVGGTGAPKPMNLTALSAFSFAVGSYTIAGNCYVTDLDIKAENKGLNEFTANFESSGEVTFA